MGNHSLSSNHGPTLSRIVRFTFLTVSLSKTEQASSVRGTNFLESLILLLPNWDSLVVVEVGGWTMFLA